MGAKNNNTRLMRGDEIAAMFGDREVFKMEQRFKAIGKELDLLGKQINSEQDPEELKRLQERIFELRVQMRELDRVIRQEHRRYSELRGTQELSR